MLCLGAAGHTYRDGFDCSITVCHDALKTVSGRWDWGPSFTPQGIYGDVQLVAYSSAQLTGEAACCLVVGAEEHVRSCAQARPRPAHARGTCPAVDRAGDVRSKRIPPWLACCWPPHPCADACTAAAPRGHGRAGAPGGRLCQADLCGAPPVRCKRGGCAGLRGLPEQHLVRVGCRKLPDGRASALACTGVCHATC